MPKKLSQSTSPSKQSVLHSWLHVGACPVVPRVGHAVAPALPLNMSSELKPGVLGLCHRTRNADEK